MQSTKGVIQISSVLCCLALGACQSDGKSLSPSSPADSISISVDEKSTVELQALIEADRYWLSYTGVPGGWNIPTEEQTSPRFKFETGPVESNTLVTLELHQLSTASDLEAITPIELRVKAVEEPPIASGEEFSVTKGLLTTHADLAEADHANLLLNDRDEPEDTAPSTRLKTTLISAPQFSESFELGRHGGWSYLVAEVSTATQDSFSYTVSDGVFDSEPVTVLLNLLDAEANSAPIVSDTCHAVPQPGNAYEGNLSVQVNDSDDAVLNYRIIREPDSGSVELDLTSGTFRYRPSTTEQGYLDSFEYEVNDLRGGSDQGTFTMMIGERRVMPLGDSITRGVESTSASTGDLPNEPNSIGYRKALKELLQASGYQINFVGPLRAGYAAGLEDAEHAGFSGWKAGDLATGRNSQPSAGDVQSWLQEHPADIVLVHAGTNDHTADASVVAPLLNEIQDWSTDHHANLQLFVASIVDQRRDNSDRAYLEPFNAGIEALVPSYQPSATFVDQFHALDWQTDITDYQIGITGLHPTRAGYEKMAAKWAEALISANALNKCP